MILKVQNFYPVNWIFSGFSLKLLGLFVPFSEEKAFQYLELPPCEGTQPLKLSYKVLFDKINRLSSLSPSL